MNLMSGVEPLEFVFPDTMLLTTVSDGRIVVMGAAGAIGPRIDVPRDGAVGQRDHCPRIEGINAGSIGVVAGHRIVGERTVRKRHRPVLRENPTAVTGRVRVGVPRDRAIEDRDRPRSGVDPAAQRPGARHRVVGHRDVRQRQDAGRQKQNPAAVGPKRLSSLRR